MSRLADLVRVVAVRPSLVERAMDLIERHGLRGYDAMHLAAALEVATLSGGAAAGAPMFVSADDGQRRAAVAEGLAVENPNALP